MSNNQFQLDTKRNCFNVKDSSISFLLSLLLPFLVSFAVLLLMLFLKLDGTEFEQIVNYVFVPVTFFLIYYFYSKKTNVNMFVASEIKFKVNWLKCLTVVVMGVSAVFLISPFVSLFDHLMSLIGYNPENDLPYVMDNGFRFVVGIISMAVLPAVCEELLFRGLIFKGLTSKFGTHASIFISATLFMLLHGSLQQTIYQFLIGVLLGYAMHFGRSVVYPILLHFVNNFLVVLSSFIYTLKGIDVNTPAVYPTLFDYVLPVIYLIIGVCVLVGLIFVLQYLNKQEVSKEIKDALSELTDEAKQELSLKSNKKSKKVENETTQNNIIESKPFSKEEKWLFYGSIGLSVFFWVVNTVMQFFGLY